eukprot:666327-Prymnesium_polylepis.1
MDFSFSRLAGLPERKRFLSCGSAPLLARAMLKDAMPSSPIWLCWSPDGGSGRGMHDGDGMGVAVGYAGGLAA